MELFDYNVDMIRHIKKSGNSMSLVISKDMRDHLGLVNDEVEVLFEKGCLVLRAPNPDAVVDDAVRETLAKYDQAFRNLAK